MDNVKILLLNFLFLFAFSIPTIAQVDLTTAQQKEYNKQKLTLEAWGSGQGSYGGGNISYTYSTKWAAYQGINRISESSFYSITGYNNLAEQARIREKKQRIYGPLKWSLLGAGLITVFAAGEDPDFIVRGIGGGILIGAIVISIADITVSGNLKPYGIASGIADDYNLQLGITLKRNF